MTSRKGGGREGKARLFFNNFFNRFLCRQILRVSCFILFLVSLRFANRSFATGCINLGPPDRVFYKRYDKIQTTDNQPPVFYLAIRLQSEDLKRIIPKQEYLDYRVSMYRQSLVIKTSS